MLTGIDSDVIAVPRHPPGEFSLAMRLSCQCHPRTDSLRLVLSGRHSRLHMGRPRKFIETKRQRGRFSNCFRLLRGNPAGQASGRNRCTFKGSATLFMSATISASSLTRNRSARCSASCCRGHPHHHPDEGARLARPHSALSRNAPGRQRRPVRPGAFPPHPSMPWPSALPRPS